MIEEVIRNYLIAQELEGIGSNVFLETPEPGSVPEEYILLERTGSSMRNHIETATIAIQSVSSVSLYRAALINNAVKLAMLYGLPQENAVFGCRINTDYNYTNTATKQYRYQAVFQITQ